MPTITAQPLRSSFATIVLAMKTQLAAITSVSADAILIVADDAVPHFMGDQDILIRVLGEKADRDRLQGNGRVYDFRTRQVRIVARSRQNLDPVDEDEIHLTDSTVGHIELEDSIADALQMFQVADTSNNLLTTAPIRVLDLTDPRRDTKDPDWISSTFSVEIDYTRALSQSRQ